MMSLVIFASIVMLAPFALYILGIIRDPFHPMIFAGALSYFLVPHRLIFNREATLEVADEPFLNPFLVVSIISMLGIYAGWFIAGWRKVKDGRLAPSRVQYDPGRLGLSAAVFAIVAGISHYT